MSSLGQIVSAPVMPLGKQQWYAVHTRPRHEKKAAQEIAAKGVGCFLPLVTERHHWSDRCKVIQTPLFSCYLFVTFDPVVTNRIAVLSTPGVLGFIGSNHQPTPIPQNEIDNVRAVLGSAAKFTDCPFLKVGQRVRIRGGALDGVEGILTARSGEDCLVISIDAIQRSLSLRIEGYNIEPA